MTSRRRAGRSWLGLMVATAVIAAGCGSSSSGSTSSSASARSSSTAAAAATSAASSGAATGAPIPVGTIGSYSGPFAGSLAIAEPVIKAWSDSVNASGGINGHPVKLFVEDDMGNPATALQDVKKLVTNDHVVAIVSDISGPDSTWASYVAAHHVPVLGGNATNTPFFTNPDFFPAGADVISTHYGAVALGKSTGKDSVALLYCAEDPSCQLETKIIGGSALALGVKFPYHSSVAITAPSYAAPCLAAKNAGASMLFVGQGAQTILKVADGCAALGYKPLEIAQAGSLSSQWLSNPNVNGAVTAQNDFPWFDTSSPATQAFHAALNKYAPGTTTSPNFGPIATYAWVSGKLFEAAAQAAHVGSNATSAQVLKGLYSLHNETLDGLAPPLNYTVGKPAATLCYFRVDVSGGKFTDPDGLKTSCMPAATHAAILKSLG